MFSGVADLKRAFEQAAQRRADGQGTLLFVDEIHRFNRAQQDGFLPVVENGTVTLVGATTENPSFALNGALLSRCQVLVLRRLDDAALEKLLARAEADAGRALPLAAGGARRAARHGRRRRPLSAQHGRATRSPCRTTRRRSTPPACPNCWPAAPRSTTRTARSTTTSFRRCTNRCAAPIPTRRCTGTPACSPAARTRATSPAAWCASPSRISAWPTRNALPQALAAWEAYERLGSPEGELAIAQAVLYLGTAPKSNAAYTALGEAQRAARATGSLMPPAHILNAPTKLMKQLGYGAGYAYDHAAEDAFSGQNYFPDGLARQEFYRPRERGFEREVAKRLAYWAKLRQERRQ